MTIKALYKVGGSDVIGIPQYLAKELKWKVGDDIFIIPFQKTACVATNSAGRGRELVVKAKKDVSGKIEKRKLIKNGDSIVMIFPASLKAHMELFDKKYVELIVLNDQMLKIQTML